jgi:hypothetical protein
MSRKEDHMSDYGNEQADMYAEACVMRLAAMAIDVRRTLKPDQIRNIPSLEAALAALDAVTSELGWDQDSVPADEPDEALPRLS